MRTHECPLSASAVRFSPNPYNEVCTGGRKDLSASDQRSGKPRRVRRQHYMGHCAMGCACQACAYMRTSPLFGCLRSGQTPHRFRRRGEAVRWAGDPT